MGHLNASIAMNFNLQCYLCTILVGFACAQSSKAVVVAFDLIPDLAMGQLGINSFDVDINADGIRDVRMISQGGTIGFQAIPEAHVRMQGVPDDPGSALAWRILAGQMVGSVPVGPAEWTPDPPNGGLVATSCVVTTQLSCNGYFTMLSGFIGIEITLADGIHYGWLDVQGYLDSGDVRAWAWETEPGVPITAPEPSRTTLIVIAFGVFLLRRQRHLND